MQKKIIAAAIIGLVSAGASAVNLYDKDGSTFGVTGKFDFAAQKSVAVSGTAKVDSYTILDGKWSTSRLVFDGKTALTSDLTAYYSYDLRLDNVFVGKGPASTPNTGGLSTNDALKGGIVSKTLGKIEAGTINVAAQQFVFKKNYVMVKESEMVKYGVSSLGLEALSNRNFYISTSDTNPVAAKFSYAISDETEKRTLASDRANLWSAGLEAKLPVAGSTLYAAWSVTVKPNSILATTGDNRIQHNEGYIAAETPDFKVDFFLSTDKANLSGAAKKGTGKHLNVYAKVGDKIELAAGIERYTDESNLAGVANNDGRGYMLGANYYATKEVSFFSGVRYDGWDRNEAAYAGKIVGNAAGFTGNITKAFGRQFFAGMNYTF